MADEQKPGAQAAQGTATQAAPATTSSVRGEAADTATKSPEQFREEQKAGADPKVASPPVEANHGEKPAWLKRREDAAKEALKDPWGTTPIQMRDTHDKYVDPQTDDAYPAQVLAPSGIAPEISNDAVADEFKVQGTLPPV